MSTLNDFIVAHTQVAPPAQSAQDIMFLGVDIVGEPDPELLKSLLQEHAGEFAEVSILDGEEHGYIELGGWLGSQELALRLMALGSALGLWQLLTPRTVLGEYVDEETVRMLADKGMITVVAAKPAVAVR